MRKLSLDRLQSRSNVGGVGVRGEKLLGDRRCPRKFRICDRFNVRRSAWSGQITTGVGVDRHFSVVFSVAVAAHRVIREVPCRNVPPRARGDTIVEHVPPLRLSFLDRDGPFRHAVVHVWLAVARQLVADGACVLSFLRDRTTHARCQSSAPLMKLPWRSWPALCWNSRASDAILLMSSSGSMP